MLISKNIAAIGRYLRRQRNRYMAPLGLKGLHARLLLDILEHPGISQDGLAQKAGFDKSNIARQVAVLEEAGYVSRRPSANDKRVLELNPASAPYAALKGALDSGDTDKAAKYANILYNQSLLIAGLPIDDPAAYTEQVCSLMN